MIISDSDDDDDEEEQNSQNLGQEDDEGDDQVRGEVSFSASSHNEKWISLSKPS